MNGAIIIPPIASACRNPNCVAINTLKKPDTDADPSFIEFLTSVFSESKMYLFAMCRKQDDVKLIYARQYILL